MHPTDFAGLMALVFGAYVVWQLVVLIQMIVR